MAEHQPILAMHLIAKDLNQNSYGLSHSRSRINPKSNQLSAIVSPLSDRIASIAHKRQRSYRLCIHMHLLRKIFAHNAAIPFAMAMEAEHLGLNAKKLVGLKRVWYSCARAVLGALPGEAKISVQHLQC